MPHPSEIDLDSIYVATISTYCGDLQFKIDPRDAPDAARSFLFLARKKYYDSLSFDRVMGGTPAFIAADRAGDPGYTIQASQGPAPSSSADLVMLSDKAGRIGSTFMIVASTGGQLPDGRRIGTLLEGSDAAPAILQRFLDQDRTGDRPVSPLFIVHIKIEEFSRD